MCDRVEPVVFESRKKREELSSCDSFREEEPLERDTVCLTFLNSVFTKYSEQVHMNS